MTTITREDRGERSGVTGNDGMAIAAAVFGLGLGWNVSYVTATAERAERTQPWERGRLLGFNDCCPARRVRA